MKTYLNIGFCLLGFHSLALADQKPKIRHETGMIEEIIVTVPFEKRVADTALPIGILTGEALRKSVANSLGDTLAGEVGVTSASFGPGVGQTVIRGQSGNRVQVMQNGVNVIDASAVSPDHANGVEPLLAERLEVIRGPATLLYGNGAIGGVVNVIDNRIPQKSFDQTEFVVEQSYQSASHENKSLIKLNTSVGKINIHADHFNRENSNVDIHGYAIATRAFNSPEEARQHNTQGYIANTEGDARGSTLGFSLSGDAGFVGVSANRLDNNYGLPPVYHPSEDTPADSSDAEFGSEFTRIDLSQTRYDVRAGYSLNAGFINKIEASLSRTDYEHREIEIEGESITTGTIFSNIGNEARITVSHAPIASWSGVWGAQFSDTRFSALGDEAFIPRTSKKNLALFLVENRQVAAAYIEAGVRAESIRTSTANGCETEESTVSASLSVMYNFSDSLNFLTALSTSERAATIEELYSNLQASACTVDITSPDLVLHVSTDLFEVGNPDLATETSTNLEFGLSKNSDDWTADINVFYNKINDYIYLNDTGLRFQGSSIASYEAEDAVFYGVETRLAFPFTIGDGQAEVSFKGDLVRAKFDSLGYVPRIPPARIGFGAGYQKNNWSLSAEVTRVFSQHQVATNESSTGGYTLLECYADYHWQLGESELLVYARASNLLDEEIRNHVSFLKDIAPGEGRGIRVGIRFNY